MGTSERTRTQRALPEAVASENDSYAACCAVLHAGTLGRHGGQDSSKADTTSQLLTTVPSEGNRNILCSTYPRTRRRMRDSRHSRWALGAAHRAATTLLLKTSSLEPHMCVT